MSVPIIKMIGTPHSQHIPLTHLLTQGLGLGLLIWGMSNLAMGWCIGNFGLFGLDKDEVDTPVLNYIGFAVAIVSVVFYAFVKPSVESVVDTKRKRSPYSENYSDPER